MVFIYHNSVSPFPYSVTPRLLPVPPRTVYPSSSLVLPLPSLIHRYRSPVASLLHALPLPCVIGAPPVLYRVVKLPSLNVSPSLITLKPFPVIQCPRHLAGHALRQYPPDQKAAFLREYAALSDMPLSDLKTILQKQREMYQKYGIGYWMVIL